MSYLHTLPYKYAYHVIDWTEAFISFVLSYCYGSKTTSKGDEFKKWFHTIKQTMINSKQIFFFHLC